MIKEKFFLEEINSYDLWIKEWKKIEFANLMQSWEYGEAKRKRGLTPIRYLIKNEKNEIQGLLQVLFKGFPIIGGFARINRGPVYFKDMFSSTILLEDMAKTWEAIKYEGRKRRWWIIFTAPETTELYEKEFFKLGFKESKNKTPWGSIRLLLTKSEEDLFMNLKGKWRNLLRKAQKLNVEIEEVQNKDDVFELIEIYDSFQKEKDFKGVPKELLYSMYEFSNIGMIFKVYKTFDINEKLSGFVFIIYHGDAALYLVGWTSNEGRKQEANYILLWHAILEAKKNGIKWFDLGGITKNTLKGIKHFKEGINGEFYSLSKNFYKL
jgi:lipid II:glycine glycyltransferase (peptidoglycan interpeptide bridge formation enzyme)